MRYTHAYVSANPNADIDLFLASEDGIERKLPECSCCGEKIWQDSAVKIDGQWYCDQCLADFRQDIE